MGNTSLKENSIKPMDTVPHVFPIVNSILCINARILHISKDEITDKDKNANKDDVADISDSKWILHIEFRILQKIKKWTLQVTKKTISAKYLHCNCCKSWDTLI
jgi:hypothetical protein